MLERIISYYAINLKNIVQFYVPTWSIFVGLVTYNQLYSHYIRQILKPSEAVQQVTISYSFVMMVRQHYFMDITNCLSMFPLYKHWYWCRHINCYGCTRLCGGMQGFRRCLLSGFFKMFICSVKHDYKLQPVVNELGIN